MSKLPQSGLPAQVKNPVAGSRRRVRPEDRADWVDYAADLKMTSRPLLRWLYMTLGIICTGLAVLGVILPGFPTTMWLLIAAWLFSKSNPRFFNLIMNHRVFGPFVRDYRAGNGVTLRVKIVVASCITLFAGSSALFLIKPLPVRLIVAAVALFGICFITLWVPTKRDSGQEAGHEPAAAGLAGSASEPGLPD
jgi:uncharacterized membrane protein YbaN (DUF454 family)